MKPYKFKHFSYGQKCSNMHLTQIRVGCSYLKSHSYNTGHSLSTQWYFCDTKNETPIHFIIDCPHFAEKRRALFDQVAQNFIPNFLRLPKKIPFNILVYWYEPFNPEMKRINGKLLIFSFNSAAKKNTLNHCTFNNKKRKRKKS